ncbi:MAG: phage head closure protein [Rhizobiales bacterium]|nr:phage head closure protein [Hyphomicrobiales bacterium]
MNIAAGLMDQRITLQAPSASVDSLGQRVETWATVVALWANVQPLRGREFFAAGAINSEAQVRVRIRYRAGVTAAWRVLWKGVPHAIVAEPVDVNGGRHTLELLCSAGIRDGAAP